MEIINNTLCLSAQELTAGIMSLPTVQKMAQRGQVTQVRRACYGNCALYSVESLPIKYRAEVYRRHPDLQEKAESKPFVDRIEVDWRAVQHFADYTFDDGRYLPMDKQAELANNCAIMNAFRKLMEECNSHHIRQSKPRIKKGDFWRKAADALPRIAEKWPHSLPEHWQRLQSKFGEYVRMGYDCFITAKYRNTNALKVDDDVKESLLLQLIAHHNNLDNAQIAALYNLKAREEGWEEISNSTVAVWKEKYDLVTASGRLGETRFRNTKTMQVKRSRPTAPFLFWTLDGWDVELLYQATKTDKNGHSVTTYSNRMTVEVVLDPCNNYPIGFAIGTHETPELIKEALRNAALHSREITGEMLRANQIQCDHYAIKAMTSGYRVMADKLTPARVKNAKAKEVERYFIYLNKKYCQMMNNWSGFGVTTDPMKQPNSEALNLRRHSFPDEQGIREQISKIIELDRAVKIEQFREMLTHLPAERRLPLTKENYLLYFGEETGYRNAIEGQGLCPKLLGKTRAYDCFDIRFRQWASVRWRVKYDPDDLSEVLAVNDDGTLRFMLEEKYVQPMALADRKDGDSEQLQRVRDFNERLESHVENQLSIAYHKTEELLGEGDDNILKRLLIVDSRGQHKLPKAQMRLQQGVEDISAEPAVNEIPIAPKGIYEGKDDDYSIF